MLRVESEYLGIDMIRRARLRNYVSKAFSEDIRSFSDYISLSDEDYKYNRQYLVEYSKEYRDFIHILKLRLELYDSISSEISEKRIPCTEIIFDECIRYVYQKSSFDYSGLVDNINVSNIRNKNRILIELPMSDMPDFCRSYSLSTDKDDSIISKSIAEKINNSIKDIEPLCYFR